MARRHRTVILEVTVDEDAARDYDDHREHNGGTEEEALFVAVDAAAATLIRSMPTELAARVPRVHTTIPDKTPGITYGDTE